MAFCGILPKPVDATRKTEKSIVAARPNLDDTADRLDAERRRLGCLGLASERSRGLGGPEGGADPGYGPLHPDPRERRPLHPRFYPGYYPYDGVHGRRRVNGPGFGRDFASRLGVLCHGRCPGKSWDAFRSGNAHPRSVLAQHPRLPFLANLSCCGSCRRLWGAGNQRRGAIPHYWLLARNAERRRCNHGTA